MFKVALVLLLLACSKSGSKAPEPANATPATSQPDDCHRLANAMARAMKDAPMPPGKSIDDLKDTILEGCKKDPEVVRKDPDAKCVLEAKSEAAEDECLKKGLADYTKKSKVSEAELQLNRIGKSAKVAYITNAAFPTGKSRALPASPNAGVGGGCCGGKSDGTRVDNKCAATKDWASDPVWQALEFSIDEPTMYRYAYASVDGKSFTATASADVDCDGQEATWTLTGTIDSSNNPTLTLTKPPAGSY